MAEGRGPVSEVYLKPSIEAVERILAERVRPLLQLHGGDVEVKDVDASGRVYLRFVGACCGCFLRPMTIAASVAPALRLLEGVASFEVEGMVIPVETLMHFRGRIAKGRIP